MQVPSKPICDLERRCIIDLLPDREGGTVAAWLAPHPGVEIVCRDRGSGFREGATKGAPQALQICDRWPLLENATAAFVAAKITQDALGEAVGISFQQGQKYELGEDRVAASTLQGIAATLGVHPGSFFDDAIPAQVARLADLKAAFEPADVLAQIRDPRVLKQFLALGQVLGESEP